MRAGPEGTNHSSFSGWWGPGCSVVVDFGSCFIHKTGTGSPWGDGVATSRLEHSERQLLAPEICRDMAIVVGRNMY